MDILEFFNKLNIPNQSTDSPYIKALHFKNGEPLKIFSLKDDIELLFKLDNDKYKKLITFLSYNKEVLFIPLEFIDGRIFGFVLRSLTQKAFYNFKIEDNLPMVFGLNDFSDFEFGQPIFLAEGIKDVQTIKLFYKYSLAYLTSQPAESLWNYLNTITNNIIIIGDNDKTGKKLILDNKIKEKYKHCKIYYLNGKDGGEYWEGNNFIYNQIKIIVSEELNGEKI